MMAHFNELHLILNKYLKWNKSHVKCFTLIMIALIVKQTCNLSSASKALPIKCLPQSFYRRIQRFFAGQYFDYRQISQLIFNRPLAKVSLMTILDVDIYLKINAYH